MSLEFAVPEKVKGTAVVTIIGQLRPRDVGDEGHDYTFEWSHTDTWPLYCWIGPTGTEPPSSAGQGAILIVTAQAGGSNAPLVPFTVTGTVPIVAGDGEMSLYIDYDDNSNFGFGLVIGIYTVTADFTVATRLRAGKHTARGHFS